MKAIVIYDTICGENLEIVMCKGEVSYNVIMPRTAVRNWEVMCFGSLDEIIAEYKANKLEIEASEYDFIYRRNFASKWEYNMYLNRQISEIEEISCFGNRYGVTERQRCLC